MSAVTVRITETTDISVEAGYGEDRSVVIQRAMDARAAGGHQPNHCDATVLEDHFDAAVPFPVEHATAIETTAVES